MKLFITGGTGLVGSHVAELVRSQGDDVVALVRAGSDTAHLSVLGCELVELDLSAAPPDALADAMRGCDALVHAAAIVARRVDWDTFRSLNVGATEAVFEAACRARVARVVHVSSVAVYGGVVDAPVHEERWQERPMEEGAFYARSKRMAEEVAWRFHAAGRTRVSTVRPSVIYGERDRHVVPRLDRAARAPVLPLPDGGRHPLPLVYAGNVAAGVRACLLREQAAGRAYNLTGDHPLSARRLLELWCRHRGLRMPRVLSLPGGALVRAADLADRLGAAAPGVRLPRLGRPARLLRAPQPYDSSRARSELDWTDLVPPEEALRRTADWWRNETTEGGGGT